MKLRTGPARQEVGRSEIKPPEMRHFSVLKYQDLCDAYFTPYWIPPPSILPLPPPFCRAFFLSFLVCILLHLTWKRRRRPLALLKIMGLPCGLAGLVLDARFFARSRSHMLASPNRDGSSYKQVPTPLKIQNKPRHQGVPIIRRSIMRTLSLLYPAVIATMTGGGGGGGK